MKKRTPVQTSESFWVCSLLSMVGGFLDVYTYISRGHVFANAQTGNVVLLGLTIANGEIKNALYYFLPILSFALGILFTESLRQKCKDFNRLHWRQIVVAVEAALLVIPAFLPSGNLNVVVNVLISFVCGVQVETFRKVNGHAVATTMCTGNLRIATEHTFHYLRFRDQDSKKSLADYYKVIFFFLTGAVLGTLTTLYFAEKSVLVCSVFLLITFVVMFIEEI